jgi:hypothetical protein
VPYLVKIAEPDELPPGKGKTLLLEGREVTVFNQEGRMVATATSTRILTHPPVAETTCEMPGHHFDVHLESSPARLRTDELHCQVVVEEDGVYVLLGEA